MCIIFAFNARKAQMLLSRGGGWKVNLLLEVLVVVHA